MILDGLNTHQLQQGDVVLCHGMRCLIDGPLNQQTREDGRTTVWTHARVLNADEVIAADRVPASFIHDGRWTIQGNELARWMVER